MTTLLHSSSDGDKPVVVCEENGIRTLHFGGDAKQSCLDVQMPQRLVLAYTRWMMSGLLLAKKLEHICILGLGGGAMVRFIHHHHPDCRIDAVELSAAVIAQAREHFSLPGTTNLRIIQADAKHFVEAPPHTPYDLILVDIFQPEAMAAPLFSEAFYYNIKAMLHPEGVMAANLWSGDKKAHNLAKKAAAAAFLQQLLEMRVKKRSNTILLAFPGPVPRKRLHRARKEASRYRHIYGINFPKYFKNLRRNNRLQSLLFLGSYTSCCVKQTG
jgi:spermidine synthase